MHEFSQFRNALFQEKNAGEEVLFRKTSFCKFPILSNYVDTFQAMLIVLEITQRLKYVFPGINTMPHIVLSNGNNIVWEEFDICYTNVLMPCFIFALKKQEISIQLDLTLPDVPNAISTNFKRGEVDNRMLPEQDEKYSTRSNQGNTTYSLSVFNQFMDSFNMHEINNGY